MVNIIEKGKLKKSLSHNDLERFIKENYTTQYNTISNRIEIKRADGQFVDVDENSFAHEIAKKQELAGFSPVNKDTLFTILASEDVSRRVNPIEDWLKGLKKYELVQPVKQLCDFIVLKDETDKQRFVKCFEKWFVGAIKTLLTNYVHRQCIVLTGGQGIGKTSFFNALLPGEIAEKYTKNIKYFNPLSKDSVQVLTRHFIGYLDEVGDVFGNKMTRDNYKELMTCLRISERQPYAKTETTRKRIMSFLATCNEAHFLNDETGTQRFSVFEVKGFWNKKEGFTGKLSIEHFMKENMWQVWSWAYNEYLKGAETEYSKEEEVENEEKNEMYKYNTPEYEILCQYMSPSTKEAGGLFYTTTQISVELNYKQQGVQVSTDKLGKALIRAGFEKAAKRVDGKLVRGYYIKILA
jgi:predicted P-loop ATPase